MFVLGCSMARQTEVENFLNDRYEECLLKRKNLLMAYTEMVENNPYRVLSSYTYSREETPLRSTRILTRPPLTDVITHNFNNIIMF